MTDTKVEERIRGVIRSYFFDSGIVHDPSIPAELASEIVNAYNELHPPVSEGMRFTARDFLDDTDEYIGKSPQYLKMHVLIAEMHSRKANAKLQRILAQGVRVLNTERGVYIKDDINPSGIVINIEEVTK